MVGGSQVRVMVNRDGVFAEAPRRLQTDEHIAHRYAGNCQPVAGPIHLTRRLAPGFQQLALNRLRETGVPSGVGASVHVPGCQTQLFFGKGIGIVAATLDYAMHQFIAVSGNVLNVVASALQGVEYVDGRGRRVQAHGVADAGVLGRIVAQG